jgi:hypothetical protein
MIEEQRQSILQENNTAQQTLEFLLDRVGPNTRDVIISEPLSGDLNFSILKTKGFRNVKKIHFTTPGNITSITNLPYELVSFQCPNQLLVEFSNILPSLEELVLENNHLSKIDMSSLSKLKILNVNNNQLTHSMDFSYNNINTNFKTIERLVEFSHNLPKTLEELYISHNKIGIIDLKHLVRLRVLHAVGNRLLRIQNVPASIVDLQIEDNPLVDVELSSSPAEETKSEQNSLDNQAKRMDYLESLQKYFEMKTHYEEELLKKRKSLFYKGKTRKQGSRIAKEYRPKCIKCTRPFGTIFESRDRRYIARCGNTGAPCDLKIQLFRGDHHLTEDMLYLFQYQLESSKETIISQKLDTLFNYLSEEQSVAKFQKELKNYSVDNSIFRDVLTNFNDLHYSPHKRELIRNKIVQIYELKNAMKQMLDDFQKNENMETMRTITEIYKNEYLPEIHNLRLLNYEVMEMNIVDSSCLKDECPEMLLFQKDASLQKLEHVSGETPRVLAFTI